MTSEAQTTSEVGTEQVPDLEPVNGDIAVVLQPVGMVLYAAIELLSAEYPGWAAMLSDLYETINSLVTP